MAAVTIYGPTGALVTRAVSTSVWVKTGWTGEWTWIPWLYPNSVTWSVWPNVGDANFEFDYGHIKRPELALWDFFYPLFINGCYIMVMVHNEYGAWPAWIGTVEAEDIAPAGKSAYAQGTQTFQAHGLEHIWDRIQISGVWTESGWIDRIPVFNRRNERAANWQGNRSSTPIPGTLDVFPFGADGLTWDNLQIAKNQIHTWSPFTVFLYGDHAVLAGITEEWNVNGQSLFEVMNKLIDRRRGLGAVLEPFADGRVFLHVFSMLSDPISYWDETIPANQDQAVIVLDDNLWVEPRFTFSMLQGYDTIRVEGNFINVCMSLSAADGTLVPAWTPDEETAYKAGSAKQTPTAKDHDTARASDAMRKVYQKYALPTPWDWLTGDGEGGTKVGALPLVAYDGSVTWPGDGNEQALWAFRKRIERSLPLETEGSGDTDEKELRKPFVVIPETGGAYHFIEKLQAIKQEGGHLKLDDNELAMWIIASGIPHRWAKNHWEGAASTLVTPVFDYEGFIATVAVATDTRLAVTLTISMPWSGYHRVKTLRDDEAEYSAVLAGTVLDVQDGALVKQAMFKEMRNDVERLRKRAVFGAAYFGQPRSLASIEVKEITFAHCVGSLIRGAMTAGYWLNVGTVVTQRTSKFQGNQGTVIQTGCNELEIIGGAKRVGGGGAGGGGGMDWGAIGRREPDIQATGGQFVQGPGGGFHFEAAGNNFQTGVGGGEYYSDPNSRFRTGPGNGQWYDGGQG